MANYPCTVSLIIGVPKHRANNTGIIGGVFFCFVFLKGKECHSHSCVDGLGVDIAVKSLSKLASLL